MLLPLGSTLDFPIITANAATGVLTDATATPTLKIIGGGGGSLMTGVTTAVAKVTGVAGLYMASVSLDATKFTAGKTYAVFAGFNVLNGAATFIDRFSDPILFRAIKAETTAGVPVTQVGALSSDLVIPANTLATADSIKTLNDAQDIIKMISAGVVRAGTMNTTNHTKPFYYETADGVLLYTVTLTYEADNTTFKSRGPFVAAGQ